MKKKKRIKKLERKVKFLEKMIKVSEKEIYKLADRINCSEYLTIDKEEEYKKVLEEIFEEEYKKVPEEVVTENCDYSKKKIKKYKTVVKSKEELLKWFDENGYEKEERGYYKDNSVPFSSEMFGYCNQEVSEEDLTINDGCYEEDWFFTSEWLKKVPVEEEEK